MVEDEIPTYTIIQADGLYPDNAVEEQIFAPSPGQNYYKVNYIQTYLWPTQATEQKPWSAIPEDIRNQVDGIEVLKIGFTEEDLQLFPKLKV